MNGFILRMIIGAMFLGMVVTSTYGAWLIYQPLGYIIGAVWCGIIAKAAIEVQKEEKGAKR